MKFIHERDNWTNFRWGANALMDVMAQVNCETGFLAGRLSAIGFDSQLSTVAEMKLFLDVKYLYILDKMYIIVNNNIYICAL